MNANVAKGLGPHKFQASCVQFIVFKILGLSWSSSVNLVVVAIQTLIFLNSHSQAPSTNGSTFAKPFSSIRSSNIGSNSTNYGSIISDSSVGPIAATYTVMYCKKGPKKRKAWSDGQLVATGQRVVLTDAASQTQVN
jgi:hypothetical protein